MDFSRRTAQLLHEEHQATVTVIEALEDLIVRAKRKVPDTTDPVTRDTLQKAAVMIDQEIGSHFSFEEQELFTRLADMGDVGIGEHLTEEHQAILPVAEQVAGLAHEAIKTSFSDQNWALFKSSAGELIERMLAHIQKEEMALLPLVDELLDPQTDMELAETYSLNQ